jgi:hypothetical protein
MGSSLREPLHDAPFPPLHSLKDFYHVPDFDRVGVEGVLVVLLCRQLWL